MKIECFFAEGCGSVEQLRRHVEQAVREEGIEAEVCFHQVSQEWAERLGMGGSPTVWVNGRDIEGDVPAGGIA